MSNLILVYSVMAKEAIIKVISFWQQGVDVGSAVQQTQVSLKSKMQNPSCASTGCSTASSVMKLHCCQSLGVLLDAPA